MSLVSNVTCRKLCILKSLINKNKQIYRSPQILSKIIFASATVFLDMVHNN